MNSLISPSLSPLFSWARNKRTSWKQLISHLFHLNDIFHSLRDLARFHEFGLHVLHLRMTSLLHIHGQFLITRLPRAATATCDAHGPTKQTGDNSTQAALHPRSATATGKWPTIGSAAGPRPTRATVTSVGRQLRVSVSIHFSYLNVFVLESTFPSLTFSSHIITSPSMCILVSLIFVELAAAYRAYSISIIRTLNNNTILTLCIT